jgi:hypothetical protein
VKKIAKPDNARFPGISLQEIGEPPREDFRAFLDGKSGPDSGERMARMLLGREANRNPVMVWKDREVCTER